MHRRTFAVAIALGASLGCATEPLRGIDGTWSGSYKPFTTSSAWALTMTLSSADSLHGATDAVNGAFSEHYVVSGTLVGDSLTLSMMPVEDATIHFTGRLLDDHLVGRAWLNTFADSASPVTFTRQ